MHKRPVTPPSPILEQQVADYLARAHSLLTPEAGAELEDPQSLHRRAEALINEIDRDAADEAERRLREPRYRSRLLTIPDTELRWVDLFQAQLARSRRAVGAPGAQKTLPVESSTTALSAAFAVCEAIRHRVLQACEGTRPKSKGAIERREAVFGKRSFYPSKAAWENELRSLIATIRTPGPQQTQALLALMPRLEEALQTLEAAVPQLGGRPKKPVARWSDEVVIAQLALELAIDDFVQWSASCASDARNAAILRIAAPKRRSDSADSARATPSDARPAGAEVLVITAGSEVQGNGSHTGDTPASSAACAARPAAPRNDA